MRKTDILTVDQCKAARAMLGWSQNDLAGKAGTTQRTIADFERKARVPHVSTLKALRQALEDGGLSFLQQGETVSGAFAIQMAAMTTVSENDSTVS